VRARACRPQLMRKSLGDTFASCGIVDAESLMHDSFHPWFAPEFATARRWRLESFRSFGEVVAAVQASITRIEATKKPGNDDGLTDCWQPVFTLYIDRESFDAFYNAPCGYRAQYARDPDAGLAANGFLISKLAPVLLDEVKSNQDLAELPVRRSLEAASAKVWPLEDDLAFSRFERHLSVPRWVAAADGGSEKARMGLVAPEANLLEVKGGLLDAYKNERVPASKVRRRHHIHEFGFS
jgi:hypothetical protein